MRPLSFAVGRSLRRALQVKPGVRQAVMVGSGGDTSQRGRGTGNLFSEASSGLGHLGPVWRTLHGRRLEERIRRVEEPGLLESLALPAAILLGVFHLWNWRCPRCRRYLGNWILVKKCGHCNAKLR